MALLPTIGALFLVQTAAAQEGHEALAESLFQEGKRLLAAKTFPEACDRLAESRRIDPAGGTLFALAVCYEEEGRVVSAWVVFAEAMAAARRDQRDDRETLAREHRARLEPRLPHLELHLEGPPNVEISVDGASIPKNAWMVPLPLDPGRHLVRVVANGYRARELEAYVTEGSTTGLSIPPLQALIAESVVDRPVGGPAPLPQTAESPRGTTWMRVVGWSLVGAGSGVSAFGAYSGLQAFAKKDEAAPHCDALGCDAAGLDLLRDGHSAATRSTVAITIGATAIALGVVTLLLEHQRRTTVASP